MHTLFGLHETAFFNCTDWNESALGRQLFHLQSARSLVGLGINRHIAVRPRGPFSFDHMALVARERTSRQRYPSRWFPGFLRFLPRATSSNRRGPPRASR